MRKLIFTTSFVMGLGASLMAQTPLPIKSEPAARSVETSSQGIKTLKTRSLGGSLQEKEIQLPGGLRMKTVTGIPSTGNVLNPETKRTKRPAQNPPGFVLYENFESWDGSNEAWIPEGWSVDHRNSPQSNRGWKMTQPLSMYDFINSKCMTYEMFDVDVDEWLVTPEFTVKEGMELSWSTMTSPYFYDWDYFDNNTFQLTEYVIINDIKVNISTDGGATWTTLYSHAEELVKEAANFFAMFDYTVRPFSCDLSQYAGKSVKIGFQITGHDGNTTFIDDVSVGLPLTKTSYIRPLSGLFMGLSDTDEYVPASIMVGPVFQPITFTNTTPTKGATFTWNYEDTEGEHVSTDKNLTVTYATDHTSAATTRNNMYFYPTLKGVSSSTAEDEFTYNGFFQAGGKGEFERHFIDTDEYETIDLGLVPIDIFAEGAATWADIAVPYFGYNHESDRFWSRYTFGNDYKEDPDNWTHLEKIGEFFYTPDAPLVINGVRHNAYGKISRNVKMKAEIFPLNAAFQIGEQPVATAVCTGNDIIIVERYSANDFLCFNFKFDEPVIIDKKQSPYFLVAISGFRDPENVEYFSPEMSDHPNPNGLGLGWTGKQMSLNGEVMPMSWGSVTNVIGDDNLVSFYIMLDGTYPWLHRDDDAVTISSNSSVDVIIDSYYDGKDLQFENLPAWLTAKASGRYDKTVITFTAGQIPEAEKSATVSVSAPGVATDILLQSGSSGIDQIEGSSDQQNYVIYDLTGQKVSPFNLSPGIYIKRFADGSSVKFIHK